MGNPKGKKEETKAYKLGKNSSEIIVMPEYYKLIDKSIIKTPKNSLTFAYMQEGYSSVISAQMIDSKKGIPFDQIQSAIEEIHKSLREDQGLIEINNGVTVAGRKYLYYINKYRLEDFQGNGYHMNMEIEHGKKALCIDAFFEEAGTTGIRDAIVHSILEGQGEIGHDLEGWSEDPYDPDFKEGFLMNQSEKEMYDEMFPDHPLTKCRQMRDFFITTDMSVKEDTVKSQNKKSDHSSKAKAEDKTDEQKDSSRNNTDDSNDKGDNKKREYLDEKLKDAIDKYNDVYTTMNEHGNSLYISRIRSIDVIQNVENLINSIANHPKDFDADISEIIVKREKFKQDCDFAEQELKDAKKSAVNAGAGAAGGVAVVCLAPSAAMWVATTFGTASTGTAIATLSGAAAHSAALAWLGGGALAAGGGGMAGGTAFLALAGPVGWSIAGASILSSIVLFANKKRKLNKEKRDEIESVLSNTEHIREVDLKIKDLLDKTDQLRESLSDSYIKCLTWYKKDYMSIQEDGRYQLGTLVNQAKSLAVLLEEGI